MPIYEYTCRNCDTKFEKLVRTMGDNGKVECPECHSTNTVRALSVFAVGAEQQRSAPQFSCGQCAQNGACPMAE